MEAPVVIGTPSPEKNIPNNIVKPKNTKILHLKSDKNKDFEIQFYVYEENIIFEAYTKNIIPQKKFNKIYSFNDIQKNKFFIICENINEIFEEIQNQINEKEEQINIIEKSNLIILSIPLNTKKIKECIFEIDEIVENADIKINNLYSIINQLSKEIKDLKEKNNILEEKSYKLEEQNKILEEKNYKLEKKVEEIDKLLLMPFKERLKKETEEQLQKDKEERLKKEMKEKLRKEKEKDLNKIKEWIAPGKNIQFNLLFRKSRDGDKTADFHRLCDNKGKTLIMIETKEGRKFGGFTNESWDTTNKWKKNYDDFVFSLDLNKKYSHTKYGDSTISKSEEGPVFGNGRPNTVDIYFGDNTLNKGISNSSPSFETKRELNNINENFETKELEVYQVIIN